jgi:hypothetical protein
LVSSRFDTANRMKNSASAIVLIMFLVSNHASLVALGHGPRFAAYPPTGAMRPRP